MVKDDSEDVFIDPETDQIQLIRDACYICASSELDRVTREESILVAFLKSSKGSLRDKKRATERIKSINKYQNAILGAA